MTPAIKCLILLAVVALLFVTEMIPLAMTAVLAAIACSALGLVPENQIFLGLADSTVVLFGGMFVVGAAMFYTGLAQKVGGAVVKLFGTNENSLMFGLMVIAAVMSAFLSNTGTTACLIPVVMGGMIGDPSGKSQERNLLDSETLYHNQEAIKKQVSKFLDFDGNEPNKAELVNNYDWMKD